MSRLLTGVIYRGVVSQLDLVCLPKIKASAEKMAPIVANGELIYGINTCFGKLASVCISSADLETLQRNIVLSHAVGVGELMLAALAPLMMALKFTSLPQSASGVQPETIDLLQAMLAMDVIPVVQAQGSVGTSGDFATLSHITTMMIGVSDCPAPHSLVPVKVAFVTHGFEPITLSAKEDLVLLNGKQFSTAYALVALHEAENLYQSALVAAALSTNLAKGAYAPFDPRIHVLRKHPSQIETAAALWQSERSSRTLSTSPISCLPTSVRFSAAALVRSAGLPCQVIWRTFPKTDAKVKELTLGNNHLHNWLDME